MKTTLFFNQYSHGGAADSEAWELTPAESGTYYSAETLETVAADLPAGWSIGKNWAGCPHIYDEDGAEIIIFSKNNIIYGLSPSTGKAVKMAAVEHNNDVSSSLRWSAASFE